jgi:chromosome partitioning protein
MKESHHSHRPLIDLAPSHKLTQQYRALHAALEAALVE